MQILLDLLLRLTDFFCFLCTKREKLLLRRKLERNLFDDGKGKNT